MNSVIIDTEALLKQAIKASMKARFDLNSFDTGVLRSEQAKRSAYYTRIEELLQGVNKNSTSLSMEWLISYTEQRKLQLIEEIKTAATQKSAEYKLSMVCFHTYVALFLEALVIESETV